jgi:uncharacterized protein YciI
MPIYAVTYVYNASDEHLAEIRPLHRAWLKERFDEGKLYASGPMVDSANALLIWNAENAKDLAELLDNDPFDIAGFISERDIQEWNPVLGPWS